MWLLPLLSIVGATVIRIVDGFEYEEIIANIGSSLEEPSEAELTSEWNLYTSFFNKSYSYEESEMRKELYAEKRQVVVQHNIKYFNKDVPYKLGINQFTDMTTIEAHLKMNGYTGTLRKKEGNVFAKKGVALPRSVDWRKKPFATPIKYQGICGSCWAFSAVGAIEYQAGAKTGQPVLLSEQQLVDCSGSHGNKGCTGGQMTKAFKYIIANGGIASQDDYPYTSEMAPCKSEGLSLSASISGFAEFAKGDESGIMEALAQKGPVSAGMDSSKDSMFGYSEGILNDPSCSSKVLTHGVLIVGYGTEDNIDYWIVKNSWGKSWGEQGYFRIARKNNLCGLQSMASIPIL